VAARCSWGCSVPGEDLPTPLEAVGRTVTIRRMTAFARDAA
jgi:hypothetical protein